MKRLFTIPGSKPPYGRFPITLDLAGYLGTTELEGTLSVSAVNLNTTNTVGTEIYDYTRCSLGTSSIKIWVENGKPGNSYKILVGFQTTGSYDPLDELGLILKVEEI